MALLQNTVTRHTHTLGPLVLMGRSSACGVRIDDPRVSGEHARIQWLGPCWEIRDLGSRNGTFVNHVRLDPGGVRRLSANDQIALADAQHTWTLLDTTSPCAQARVLETGETLTAMHGVLSLTDAEKENISVLTDAEGRWVLEHDGSARPCTDGEVLRLAMGNVMLHLPAPILPTVDAVASTVELHQVRVRFRVSVDEEHVAVTVVHGANETDFPPRAHHYTLLTLARLRQRDESLAKESESLRGWATVDELCRMLASDENRLNVEIHRIRHEFGALGVQNGTAIIERRRGQRALRFGLRSFSIERSQHRVT